MLGAAGRGVRRRGATTRGPPPEGGSFSLSGVARPGRVKRVFRVVDDVEAIKQLKARYCRTMDTKDWAAMRQLFVDDVVVDTTESGGNVTTGANDFLTFLQATLADVVTVHYCHMPEIELVSPAAASGVWAMEDMLRWPDGTALHGYGHYH